MWELPGDAFRRFNVEARIVAFSSGQGVVREGSLLPTAHNRASG